MWDSNQLEIEQYQELYSPRKVQNWLTVATAAWAICITSTTATTAPSGIQQSVFTGNYNDLYTTFVLLNSSGVIPLSTTGRCKNFPSCILCSASTIGVSTVAHSGFGVMTYKLNQKHTHQ